jgi:serine-type D-Ala-D-Ala carboxypeptidase/endopeptidase
MMKRLAPLIFMLGLMAGCGGRSSSSSTTTNSLQYLISQIVRPQLDKHQRLKIGVAIGVVGPGAKGFGEVASRIFLFGRLTDQNGNRLALNESTEFEIGSVTKTFTATVLASLLQSQPGLLDTSINSIFSGTPTFGMGMEAAMIGELANYTSGLPDSNRGNGSGSCTFSGGTIDDCYDFTLLFEQLADPTFTTLQFAPGTSYLYSDLGFALLALAEPVLNGSMATDPLTLLAQWEELVGTIVLTPLGMNSTHAFNPVSDPPLLPKAYRREASGKIDVALGYNTSWPAFIGAGGIVSTPADMLLYLEYQLGLLDTPLNALLTVLHSPSTDVTTGAGEHIGLGWFIGTLRGSNNLTFISKNGSVPGFTTQIDFAPSTNTGVFVMANAAADPGQTPLVDVARIASQILQLINGILPTSPGPSGDQP